MVHARTGVAGAQVARVVAALCVVFSAECAAAQPPCLAPASWYSLEEATPRLRAEGEVLGPMARRDVVLLGEQHDDADHHAWQLQTLAALHVLRPGMAIGFEAFPRRIQPVLDQWVAGELSVQQFLERSEWLKVWSFPSELYLPLFQFARLNRIPMIALNVERSLTQAVSAKGWDAVAPAQREGVSTPARPLAEYEAELFEMFKEHASARRKDADPPGRGDAAFRFFVEAQTTWDRAMAEALAARLKGQPRPLVVGVIGAGHVRNGYGVPHQLRALGVSSVGTLLPVSASDCEGIKPALADAVFAVPASISDKPPPPRLSVSLEMVEGQVRIAEVTAGSLAEQTGLRAGDRIVSIAGAAVKGAGSVTAAVRAQPPGTWLPLQIRRGGDTVDLVVKFPARR